MSSITILDQLKSMMHSPVHNYIVPGLTSYLIGEPSEYGKVRLFNCERIQHEFIAPHSHRYNFHCIVLTGEVVNMLWQESSGPDADEYCRSTLRYKDEIGKFETMATENLLYDYHAKHYEPGDKYGMTHDQIHSIYFRKGTNVLFFEGPEVRDYSVMLEPVINGNKIPTGQVQDWMFSKY